MEPRYGGIEIKLMNIVQDIYDCRMGFDNCRQRQLQCPWALIDIPSDGHHRSYGT